MSHLDAESKSRLRYVHEPQPGLSLARNAGIHASEGTYIAFIDDDGLAEPEWLEQIVQRFDANDKIASVGGNIFPVFEETPPSWVTPQLYPYFSCFIFSKEETFLEPGRYFFGTNMAFRKDVLLASGGFDARLGRKGNSLLSNEEWTVFHYIDQQNLLKLSSPQVNVHHIIPPSRLIRRFFIRRLWWQGVSDTVFNSSWTGETMVGHQERLEQVWRLLRLASGEAPYRSLDQTPCVFNLSDGRYHLRALHRSGGRTMQTQQQRYFS